MKKRGLHVRALVLVLSIVAALGVTSFWSKRAYAVDEHIVSISAIDPSDGVATVKYMDRHASSAASFDLLGVPTDGMIDLSAEPVEGSTFDHWELQGATINGSATSPQSQAIVGNGNASVTAVFKSGEEPPVGNSWTISYNSNGGEGYMEPQVVENGQSTTVLHNDFTKEGFTFVGWKDGNGTDYEPDQAITPTSNVTLYAQWVSKVGLDVVAKTNPKDGGKATASPAVNLKAGDEVTLEAKANDGYTFSNWLVTKGDVVLEDADSATTKFVMGAEDVVVEAVFTKSEQKTWTISFDANGGDGSMKKMTVKDGDSATLIMNRFTRDGYAFTGWNTKADGSGKAYEDNDTVKPTSDMVLYAQWESNGKKKDDDKNKKTTKYTIVYDANGGDGTMDNTVVNAGDSVTLTGNKFKRNGYTFVGWNTKSNGKGAAYKNRATLTPEGDMRLYAMWERNNGPLAATADPSAIAAAASLALAGAGLVVAGRRRRA